MSISLDEVAGFYARAGWNVERVDDRRLFQAGYQGRNGTFPTVSWVREDDRFVVYSMFPDAVPQECRGPMERALTLANYGLLVGNFELDTSDGELRFKTSMDYSHDRLSYSLWEQLLLTNILTMDRYMPVLESVLEGSDPDVVVPALELEEQPLSFLALAEERLQAEQGTGSTGAWWDEPGGVDREDT